MESSAWYASPLSRLVLLPNILKAVSSNELLLTCYHKVIVTSWEGQQSNRYLCRKPSTPPPNFFGFQYVSSFHFLFWVDEDLPNCLHQTKLHLATAERDGNFNRHVELRRFSRPKSQWVPFHYWSEVNLGREDQCARYWDQLRST